MLAKFINETFATNSWDLIYFSITYAVSLGATFKAWQWKTETEFNPKLINLILFLFICCLVFCESYDVSNLVIASKLLIILASCYIFNKILRKVFY